MALAGELAKYIGGGIVKNTGKELATRAATSALSNLLPATVTKAGANMATGALAKLASNTPIAIQHATRVPNLSLSELSVAPNGSHKGLLYASPSGSDVPTLGNSSTKYSNLFRGSTGNSNVLDISDKRSANALADLLESGYKNLDVSRFNTDTMFYPTSSVRELGKTHANEIRKGVTEGLSDDFGVLRDILNKENIGWVKGKSLLGDDELIATEKSTVQNAFNGSNNKYLPDNFTPQTLDYAPGGMSKGTYDYLANSGKMRDQLYRETGANLSDADKMLANWANWNEGGRNKDFSDLDKSLTKEIMQRRGNTPVYRVETSGGMVKNAPSKNGQLSFTSDVRAIRDYLSNFRNGDNTINLYRTYATPDNTVISPEIFGTGNSQLEYILNVGDNLQPISTRYANMEGNFEDALTAIEKDMVNDLKRIGADKYIPEDQSFVSPRATIAENQASLFDQLDAPSEVKIRALNYLDKPINWADNNPAFNKLTPTQRQEFADLAVKKLGNNPTTYDINQLFDPFYKNARKENGMALFNSEENQGFLNKLGIKDYTSMKGTLANEGEHTYTLSNTTGLPYNEKITLNASVMEDMLKLQSTELHEAAHAAWLRLSPEQKISIGQDLCDKFGVDAKIGKRIASSNDLNELIAYSCEANFASGNMVGADGKFIDKVLSNSTAQRHLDNVAKMAGDVSPSFKERVMNVIRAFVDYIKAKIKGIRDIGTFDEFYDGLSSGDFAEDMATPIEKWSAPAKTEVELAKDELFNKLGALHKAREIPSEAFLSIDDMIRPENSIDDIMNYINQVYPDVAEKLANTVDKKASEGAITLYHGTPNKFEDFDENLPSVWFSDSDKNLRDTGLSIKGGQSMNIMKRQLPKDLKIADEDLADRLTRQQLQDRGYAGIAYTERGPNGDETYYEIFSPNKTLRKIPEVQQSKVELSPQQQEFFKDSKLRDANGQLIPVYHSTPADFTVFDNARLGENTGYDNTALGHFVTTDKDFSSRFKDIDGKGIKGRTMELYANVKNPITHPYMAGEKYEGAELDKIVEDYLIATDNQEFLQTLREYAQEDNSTIYDEYMDMTFGGDSPFEFSGDERDILQKKGYDAVEIVEGPKSGLVEGSKDDTPVSSYAIFDGANLKDIRNLKPTSNPDVNMSYYDGYGSSGGFAKDVKAIGTKDVAPIDPDTLPEGYDFYRKVSEKNKSKYGWVYDEVSKATGKPARRITNADLRQFLEDNYPDYVEDGKMTKYELEQRIQDAMEDELTDEAWENGADLSTLVHNKYPRAGIRDIYNDHSGRTGKLDRELSRRLGIGESTSVMMDRLNNDTGRAAGDVVENKVGIKFDNWSSDEDKVGVIGHERLHLFQNASKRNDFNYEKVKPVYQDLHEDLKKALLNEDEIRKAHAGSEFERMGGMSYWGSDIEQEARMLEAYLYSEGYVKARPYRVDEFASKMDIIKPAFDKFFKKLRLLSKAGVALPAIAGLFGIGALANKKDDKKA